MYPFDILHIFTHSACFDNDPFTRYDGVLLERMTTIARGQHCRRWKRSPAGTGKNPALVEFGLRNEGRFLYSPLANLAAGYNGTTMVQTVMRYIHAEDFVIVLDTSFDTARKLSDGMINLTAPVDRDVVLENFHGDAIQAAAYQDTVRVARAILEPIVGISL